MTISPNYYADHVTVGEYRLMGVNFDMIPSDAVGVFADSNDNPLERKDTTYGAFLFDIVEKTDKTMRLSQRITDTHSTANYLGAIVSADRETVYWVNKNRPLP